MVNACIGLEDGDQGQKVHGYLINLGYDFDPFSSNALVEMYAKLGELDDAISVFEKIKKPDIVSWNVVIVGCVLHENYNEALELLRQIRRSETHLNMFALSSALKGCAGLGHKEIDRQLHSCLIKMDVKLDLFVSVGLIDMYSKCDLMEDAKTSQNGKDMGTLFLFRDLFRGGVRFNQTTLSTVLKSTASLQDVTACGQVHALARKYGFQCDIYVINKLIDSYGKCGCVEDATIFFEVFPVKDLVSFTSMITFYAQCGQVGS